MTSEQSYGLGHEGRVVRAEPLGQAEKSYADDCSRRRRYLPLWLILEARLLRMHRAASGAIIAG